MFNNGSLTAYRQQCAPSTYVVFSRSFAIYSQASDSLKDMYSLEKCLNLRHQNFESKFLRSTCFINSEKLQNTLANEISKRNCYCESCSCIFKNIATSGGRACYLLSKFFNRNLRSSAFRRASRLHWAITETNMTLKTSRSLYLSRISEAWKVSL